MKNFYSVKDFMRELKENLQMIFFLIFENHYSYLEYSLTEDYGDCRKVVL